MWGKRVPQDGYDVAVPGQSSGDRRASSNERVGKIFLARRPKGKSYGVGCATLTTLTMQDCTRYFWPSVLSNYVVTLDIPICFEFRVAIYSSMPVLEAPIHIYNK